MLPGIVLAAGRSSRMGRAKFALPAGPGHTFVSRIAACLDEAGIGPLIVVASPDAIVELRSALGDFVRRAIVAVNERPEEGQLSSLQAGLTMVAVETRGVLVTLVDLPAVRAATVSALLAAWQRSQAPLVRPVRVGRHGHPFVATGAVIDALRHAPRAKTIREVLQPFVPQAIDVPCDDAGAFEDVDTPDDYRRLIEGSAF
jgi:CTP:molybdopterin cytidylyltransferase MocA